VKPYRRLENVEQMTEEEAFAVMDVRPWDLLDPNAPRAPEVISQGRMDICKGCPAYQPLMRRCSECGCVMPLKTLLANASCPQGKWMPVRGVPK
jgi:hypothetical protein